MVMGSINSDSAGQLNKILVQSWVLQIGYCSLQQISWLPEEHGAII